MVAEERTEQMENAALNDERIMEAPEPPLPRIAAFPTLGQRIATLEIKLDIAEDGRHIAMIDDDIPGCIAMGETREEAINKVRVLALEIIADRIEHGEPAFQ